jgi:hypothetical protein
MLKKMKNETKKIKPRLNRYFFLLLFFIFFCFYFASVNKKALAADVTCNLHGTVLTYNENLCRAQGGTVIQTPIPFAPVPDIPLKYGNTQSQQTAKAADTPSLLDNITPGSSGIQNYIQSMYIFLIGMVGIIATIVIMIGGLIWISSMGNAARVTTAKDWIAGAISGLALALFSYMILWMINPDLVSFRPLNPGKVAQAPVTTGVISPTDHMQMVCCKTESGGKPSCSNTAASACTGSPLPYPCGDNKECIGFISQTTGTTASADECPANLKAMGKCKDCVNCVKLTVDAKDGQYVEKEMGEILNNIAAISATNGVKPWLVTEAWPPAVPHSAACHTNGKCVDIDFKTYDPKSPQRFDDIKKLQELFRQQGLSTVWEPDRNESCADYTKAGIVCKKYDTTTASHLHVRQIGL